jgi:hypothetical protein
MIHKINFYDLCRGLKMCSLNLLFQKFKNRIWEKIAGRMLQQYGECHSSDQYRNFVVDICGYSEKNSVCNTGIRLQQHTIMVDNRKTMEKLANANQISVKFPQNFVNVEALSGLSWKLKG